MRPRARERLPNQIMTGLVQTVLGPVKPEDLGYTTTHEHLLIDLTCLLREPAEASGRLRSAGPVDIGSYGWTSYDAFRNRDNLELLNEDVAASEAMLYKRAGGQTIVDVTSIGIGREGAGAHRPRYRSARDRGRGILRRRSPPDEPARHERS